MYMAVELAKCSHDQAHWQAAFDLARRLRSITNHNPEQFEHAVAEFCCITDREFEDFWLEFLVVWDRVRTAADEDVFAWAMKSAEKEPYAVNPCYCPIYGKMASIAWHLSRLRGQKPFWLPRPHLASLLNTNPMKISRLVELLQKGGVIRCVNSDYSYRKGAGGKGKAKEYIFTGVIPVDEKASAA
jgi:hypothetical protein